MKRLLPSLFLLFCSYLTVLSQSPPESFKYQSIVRDASGNMLDNQAVNFQFTLIQGTTNGTTVYQEVFPVTTNNYGLVNLDIGTGSPVSGSFSAIDWSQGPYFIQTGLDITGGTNYSIMSTNELMSVPYALYAKTSGGGPPGPAGPAGPQGTQGIQGVTGQDGNTGIVQQTILTVGSSTCINGGLLIESGLDLNNDGLLSAAEITSSGFVCNGDDALDNQNLTGATLSGTILQIDIDNGTSALVDLSALQDGVDDADNDPANEFNSGAALNGNTLEIIDGGGTQSVDLSSLAGTGTDDQNLTGATLTGTALQIDIESGNPAIVDLSSLQDGVDDADNDPANEYNTGATLSGNTLEITDGGGTQSVDLSTLAGTGTDDQNLTGATLTGTALQIDIESGNPAIVDLSSLQDGVDDADNDPANEFITGAALNGNNLEITDGGGTQSVDLSTLAGTGTDNQNLTGATLTGTSLQIDIESGNPAIVDLSSLQDGVDDADNDPANEFITGATLNGNNLEITDGGGTQSVDLSSFSDDGDWTVGAGSIYNISDNIGIGTSNPTANLHVNSGRILFSLDDTSFDSYINLNDPSHNLRIQTTGSAYASFNGDRTVGLGIQSTDYVGVGTNTPNSKLELVNSEAVNALDISQSGTSGNGVKIASLNATNTSSSLWIPNASSGIGINLTMDNTASTSSGIQLINSGIGLGIALQNDNDYAGELINLTSATNDYSALQINHAGTGFGTSVYHTGTGYGHYIDMSNTTAANSNQAVLGLHSGTATASAIRVGDFEYIGTTLNDNIGVFGYSNPGTGWGIGGQFQGGYIGVAGFGDDYGVVGFTGATAAVFANGDLGASGVKTFMIDHPDDPANKLLNHFSIESDEVLNIYRGIAILNNNGEAEIELASYFDKINTNFSYQLTAIGTPNQPYILKEIEKNKFSVAGTPNTKVSWLVIAERNDEYLQQNPNKRATEVTKKGKEKGKYLMPELYGLPKNMGFFSEQEKTERPKANKVSNSSKQY